jgi:hypothetical protein
MDKTQEKKIEVIICVPQDILIQATAWCNTSLLLTEWKQEETPVLTLNTKTWEVKSKVKFLFSSPKVATMFILKFA